MNALVPVVDVFAGCGGLSEGFARIDEGRRFDVALAFDNDPFAHQTHLLRSFYHQFPPKEVPEDYYRVLRSEISLEELFERYAKQAGQAQARIHCKELGGSEFPDECLHRMIDGVVDGQVNWVLIGGPPCQAYSVAGRSRNKGNAGYDPASDKRHFLYREYLKILHRHRPAVFVMENVPGILNSKVNGHHVWHHVLEDLIDPSAALGSDAGSSEADPRRHGYHLYSLVTPTRGLDIFGVPMLEKDEYIVRCEDYGVPQVRQRVLLLGVRADIVESPRTLRRHNERPTVGDVLEGLPRIRSGLSRIDDTAANWEAVVKSALHADWWDGYEDELGVRREIECALGRLKKPRADRGSNFVRRAYTAPRHLAGWYMDERVGGVCNHESKAHMETDIHRYLFAACHARVSDRLLRLVHFPEGLLPQHENVRTATRKSLSHSNFADRFAVQLADEPARTVVSHISKDGHYYIHPDPTQCRSLTVREAARLQTFPDNFFLMGNRTEQYRQVGNAVPPLLSLQIAEIVSELLERAGG